MAGRGGVEHDVVVGADRGRFGEEPRESVERGDLDGAGAGELLLKGRELGVGQHAAVGVDDPRPVLVGGDLRVEVHHVETSDRSRPAAGDHQRSSRTRR